MTSVAAINDNTLSEGPHRRFAIWVQGCSINCAGCCNKSFQEFNNKNMVDNSVIKDMILKSKTKYGIEGITLLGGEPLEHYSLIELAQYAKSIDLGVLCFSGFTINKIRKMDTKDLLLYCDTLVDGPFIQKLLIKNRRWVGSSNQNVHHLTDRYKNEFDDAGQSIDITYVNGVLKITGWPQGVSSFIEQCSVGVAQ